MTVPTSMPLCFAYGSNMDRVAMAQRCPRSSALGPARLVGFRPALMAQGFATVTPDIRAVVWGLLWDVAVADMTALDRYEEVARGLYAKRIHAVIRKDGHAAQAIVYVGAEGRGTGVASPDYGEGIVDAAKTLKLPPAYIAQLRALFARVTPALRR